MAVPAVVAAVPGGSGTGKTGHKTVKEAVAEASKRFFSLRDTYGVSIADGEDDALILATVVVIDLVLHEDDQE